MLILILLLSAFLAHAAPTVVAVNVDSVIHPITVEIVGHAIDQASRENAAAVLLRLNTPGGLLDATREINSRIIASRTFARLAARLAASADRQRPSFRLGRSRDGRDRARIK